MFGSGKDNTYTTNASKKDIESELALLLLGHIDLTEQDRPHIGV